MQPAFSRGPRICASWTLNQRATTDLAGFDTLFTDQIVNAGPRDTGCRRRFYGVGNLVVKHTGSSWLDVDGQMMMRTRVES
jgi:hypothetical protein